MDIKINEYDSNAVAKRLRDLIKEKFSTREEFSNACNISIQTINTHCKISDDNKLTTIRSDNLAVYSQVLGVSTDYILFGKECQPVKPADHYELLFDMVRDLVQFHYEEKLGRHVLLGHTEYNGLSDQVLFGTQLQIAINSTPLCHYLDDLLGLYSQKALFEQYGLKDYAIENQKNIRIDDYKKLISKAQEGTTNG